MTIELNEYGFMLDMGDFIYLSLSWAFLILSSVVFIGYKIYKKVKNNRTLGNCLPTNTSDTWGE
jgi:hypothetical protein